LIALPVPFCALAMTACSAVICFRIPAALVRSALAVASSCAF